MRAVINNPAFAVSAQPIIASVGAAALDAATTADGPADSSAVSTLSADMAILTSDATNASADLAVTSDPMVQAESIAGETHTQSAEEGATPPLRDFVTLPEAAVAHLPILPERAASRIPPEFLAPPALILPSFESSPPGAAVAGAHAAHAFGGTPQSAAAPESRAAPPKPLVDDAPTGGGHSDTQGDAVETAVASTSSSDDATSHETDPLIEQWFARQALNDDMTLLDDILRGGASANESSTDGTVAAAWQRSHAWLNGRLDTSIGEDSDASGGYVGATSFLGDTGTFIDMPRPVVGLRNVAGHDLKPFSGLREGMSVLA
jgi:hypothetical protein